MKNRAITICRVQNFPNKKHRRSAFGEQAEDMFLRLVKQLAERKGVTQQLKEKNQIEWVGVMNSIRHRAMEIVNTEFIFV